MDHMDTFNSSNLSIGSTTCFHVTTCFICQYNRRFAETLQVATFSTWSKGTRKFIRHSESELEPSTEPSNSLPGKAWHCENVGKCVKSWPSTRSSTGLELQFFESPDGEDKHLVKHSGWNHRPETVKKSSCVDPCWSMLILDWHLGTFLRTFTTILSFTPGSYWWFCWSSLVCCARPSCE